MHTLAQSLQWWWLRHVTHLGAAEKKLRDVRVSDQQADNDALTDQLLIRDRCSELERLLAEEQAEHKKPSKELLEAELKVDEAEQRATIPTFKRDAEQSKSEIEAARLQVKSERVAFEAMRIPDGAVILTAAEYSTVKRKCEELIEENDTLEHRRHELQCEVDRRAFMYDRLQQLYKAQRPMR